MVIVAEASTMPIGLRIRWEGEACVVHVSGELDLSTVPLLRDALEAVTDSESNVIVDLDETSFADSAGIQPVVETAIAARGLGRSVRMRNLPGSVKRMATVIGPLADALAAHGPPPSAAA
jgi:anti-anti-sigma factor